jgi:hypothetical protein
VSSTRLLLLACVQNSFVSLRVVRPEITLCMPLNRRSQLFILNAFEFVSYGYSDCNLCVPKKFQIPLAIPNCSACEHIRIAVKTAIDFFFFWIVIIVNVNRMHVKRQN